MVPRARIQRVLVVEDIEPVRRAVCRAVRLLLPDAALQTAVDGLDATSKLRGAEDAGASIDLCVTDHHLPHLTGLDLVENARPDGPTSFIVTSGRVDDAMRERAERLGVPLLDKPFSVESFGHELDRLG